MICLRKLACFAVILLSSFAFAQNGYQISWNIPLAFAMEGTRPGTLYWDNGWVSIIDRQLTCVMYLEPSGSGSWTFTKAAVVMNSDNVGNPADANVNFGFYTTGGALVGQTGPILVPQTATAQAVYTKSFSTITLLPDTFYRFCQASTTGFLHGGGAACNGPNIAAYAAGDLEGAAIDANVAVTNVSIGNASNLQATNGNMPSSLGNMHAIDNSQGLPNLCGVIFRP